MESVNIDTTSLADHGKSIISLSNELQVVINSLFDKIHNMPITTGEWIGQSAEKFAKTADNDRAQYLGFCKEIYNYGKFLVEYSESTDESIKGVDVR